MIQRLRGKDSFIPYLSFTHYTNKIIRPCPLSHKTPDWAPSSTARLSNFIAITCTCKHIILCHMSSLPSLMSSVLLWVQHLLAQLKGVQIYTTNHNRTGRDWFVMQLWNTIHFQIQQQKKSWWPERALTHISVAEKALLRKQNHPFPHNCCRDFSLFPVISVSLIKYIIFLFNHCFIIVLVVMNATFIKSMASWGFGLTPFLFLLPTVQTQDWSWLLLVFFCSFLLLNISLPHTETMIKINVSPQHFHPQILISLLTSNRNYLEKSSVFLERGPSILLILPITIRRTISINSLQIKVHVSNNTISNGFCFYLIFIRTPYVNLFLLI